LTGQPILSAELWNILLREFLNKILEQLNFNLFMSLKIIVRYLKTTITDERLIGGALELSCTR
jgi:hypothetical protein